MEDAGTPGEDPDEIEGELLNLTGLHYFHRYGEQDQALADVFQFRRHIHAAFALVTGNTDVAFFYDRPFAATPGDLRIDVERQVAHLRAQVSFRPAARLGRSSKKGPCST